MRNCEPLREEPYLIEPADEAAGIVRISPFALALRLEKMHMNAPLPPCRGFGNRCHELIAAPLRRDRPVLDGKQRVLERGNGIDPGQLLGFGTSTMDSVRSLKLLSSAAAMGAGSP